MPDKKNQEQGQGEKPVKPVPKSQAYANPNGKLLSTYSGSSKNPSGYVDRPILKPRPSERKYVQK